MFILLGRDRHAPPLVRAWADEREKAGEDASKVDEARACADAMEEWRANRVRNEGRELPAGWTVTLDPTGDPDVITITDHMGSVHHVKAQFSF